MMRILSLMVTERLGPAARSLFLAGALCGLYSTVCVALVANCGVLVQFFDTAAVDPQPIEHARFAAYCEGPVFDYDGNLFVSHGKSSVAKITPDRGATLWLEAEHPNGHKVLPDGTHLLCVRGAILHLDLDATLLGKASTECNGVPLRAPNDIALAPRGGFYFTDPGGSRTAPIGTVHYVDAAGKTHLVATGLWVPNGLVLSPDGQRLYVAETVPNRILWFKVKADGALGVMNVFASLPSSPEVQAEPDGLAVDANGNLYVAHLGMSSIQVLHTSPQSRGQTDSHTPGWKL